MRITKELVNAVLAKSGPEELGKTLEHILRVNEAVEAIKERWLAAEQRYVKALRELRAEQETLRKTCPHPLLKHVGDPSDFDEASAAANYRETLENASYSECVVCGLVESKDRGGYDG